MTKNKKSNESTYISEIAVHGLQEKKGNDIVRVDLRKLNASVTDFFVISHADSSTQVRALADSVEKEIYSSLKQDPWRKEGYELGEWVLLDYINVVVHIFKTEKRSYYGIEDLWGDAKMENYKSA
ncbi:ribosome silencing factor [Albibacterium indicum]|uniref:ribosome silencing factor n=1 Tax=Albibacterium indicum TaxID=2292082 RepID=UPI000E46A368|nr:ribosome silencing factor [Pedobacter indicus]